MKKKIRLLMAAALSASLTFTAAVPGFAAESEALAGGSIELPGDLAEGAGELEQAFGQAEAGTVGVTAKVEFSEAMQQLLSQSEGGTDMSWLGSVTADVAATTSEDGSVDAGVKYSLNDTPVMDGLFSYDAADSTFYFQLPQIKDQAFSMNLNDLLGQMTGQGQDSLEQAMGQLNISPEDAARLQSEAAELFGSITSDDVSAFIGRYAEAISSGVTVEDAGTAPVTAGSLSTDAALATVSVQPEAMDQILQSSVSTLRDDDLIVRIVGSDFAADLVNLLGSSTSDTGAASDPVTGDDLVMAYQQFLDENKDKLEGLPGFSLTYGSDAEGKLAYVQFKILYSGAEFEIFTWSGINDGTQNAYEFNLGQMIVQALSSSSESSADGSGAQSQTAVTGKTGLLAEGAVQGGKLNETVTIRYNDQAVFALQLADWDVEKFKQGSLDGNIAVSVEGTDIRLAFESAAPDAQAISFLVNEQPLLTITAQQREADPSEVQLIDKASATPITSQEDLDAFLSDADPSQLLQALAEAGVPQELLGGAESDSEAADTVDDAA